MGILGTKCRYEFLAFYLIHKRDQLYCWVFFYRMEEFEDTKLVIRSRKSKKDKTIQWRKEEGQDNTMEKRRRTRQYNGEKKKNKKTNNNQQNTTQKT